MASLPFCSHDSRNSCKNRSLSFSRDRALAAELPFLAMVASLLYHQVGIDTLDHKADLPLRSCFDRRYIVRVQDAQDASRLFLKQWRF